MDLRKFEPEDAGAVADLIADTLRRSNSRDYPPDFIEASIRSLGPDSLRERAGWTHFYLACDEGQIVGCGAIGPYWGKEDESSLFNLFVRPEYQRRGIGRAIIQTLEQDPYFLRARRVEIPASLTAVPFYRKMGYLPKPGSAFPDDEGLVRMEKYPPQQNP